MISTKLKIGLDYHGVIDSNPDYFKEFCCYAKSKGHLIYIISGASKVFISDVLEQLRLPYDYIFSILDYCLALGYIEQHDNGLIINNLAWNKAKSDFCRRCNIDLHIDDSDIYLQHFLQPYCLYDNIKKVCQIQNGQIINFNQHPSVAIDSLVAVIKKPSC